MSDLEKYFIENRDSFNSEEPGAGHHGRFSAKLNAEGRNRRKLNVRYVLQIAASVAVILASGIVIVKSSKGGSKVAMTPAVEEFQEARNYYATQVNARYNDISNLQFNNEEEKEVLLKELSSMDSYYKELLKELNTNPGDERAMNALISHYQIKLQVMDQIINQLEEIKRTKNINKNESKSL